VEADGRAGAGRATTHARFHLPPEQSCRVHAEGRAATASLITRLHVGDIYSQCRSIIHIHSTLFRQKCILSSRLRYVTLDMMMMNRDCFPVTSSL
jgi:hypothetical protein